VIFFSQVKNEENPKNTVKKENLLLLGFRVKARLPHIAPHHTSISEISGVAPP
jgi:hypothetical protein